MTATVKFNTTITLQSGKEISEVTITETMKHAGILRGLKLWEVATGDVNSLITLLPRVTSPRLSEADVANMPIDCFAQLANEVAVFLAPSSPVEETVEQEN